MTRSSDIETAVGTIHVTEHGAASDPALLLWPSLWCTGEAWDGYVAALTPLARVVVLDPPGHGRSGRPPRRFTLKATADATATVLDSLGIQSVVLIGSAWGGMVGVELARSHPDRVRGLVMLNSPLDRWRGRQRIEMIGLCLLVAVLGPRGIASLIARNMFSSRTRLDRPETVRTFTTAMRGFDRRNLYRAARSAMLARPSLLPLLPTLGLPVLAMAGSDDVLLPADRAAREVAMIPHAHFEVIAGTAHATALEAPETVTPLLLQFVADNGQP